MAAAVALAAGRSGRLRTALALERRLVTVRSLHTFPSCVVVPFRTLCCFGESKHFENKARREWWSLHIETWRRSGLGIRRYCQQQRLTENTLRRWLKRLAGNETALKLENYRRNCAASAPGKSEKRRSESRSSAGSRSPRMCATGRLRHSGRCMSRH
ncbi:IS66 family insertion sequence element accessory protein TnpA [Bradyrhizobium oligotrophicum]|uniref:IS66 family insertion sequence element accessory protein TnpA n=1 Tax=Bradyrhizobium oligotrophicum TaxID=44255 RepID=UPI003A8E2C07